MGGISSCANAERGIIITPKSIKNIIVVPIKFKLICCDFMCSSYLIFIFHLNVEGFLCHLYLA